MHTLENTLLALSNGEAVFDKQGKLTEAGELALKKFKIILTNVEWMGLIPVWNEDEIDKILNEEY